MTTRGTEALRCTATAFAEPDSRGTSPVMTTESRGIALHCNRILGTGQPGTKSGHDRLSSAAHHLNASKRQRCKPTQTIPGGPNLTVSARSLLASFPRKREPRATKILVCRPLFTPGAGSGPPPSCCVPKDWRDGARLCQALEMLRQRLLMREEAQLVPVAHRRDPRAGAATPASLAARRAGGPCGPTGASVSRRQPACRKPSKGSAG